MRHKRTQAEIEEERQFSADVDRLVKCRAIFDAALEEFVKRYKYTPTRVWTDLHPARFTAELWIGCTARGRDIVFPRTLIASKERTLMYEPLPNLHALKREI